jgi:hypothetical protein
LLFAVAASLLTVLALPLLGGTNAVGAQTPAATGTPVPAGGTLTASPTALDFGGITLGDFSATDPVTLTNNSTSAVTITSITIGGTASNDFAETDNCTTVAAGASCVVNVFFVPGALGARQATLTPVTGSTPVPVVALTGTGTEGYYEVTAQGAVAAYGDANGLGGLTGTTLAQPIVASATTGDDTGYWLAAADGGVFTFGSAGYFGSTGAIHLNKPIVAMAATADDGGYWLVASDGGVFTFGDALYYGSTGAIHLNQPIVGMAATPDGGGYWLMASDGGIFTFGDAPFDGSSAGTAGSYVSLAGDAPPTLQAILDQPAARRAAHELHQVR